MSDHVKLTATFHDSGYRLSSLRELTLSGDAVAAVEAARAILSGRGIGSPKQATVTVRAVNSGPASFEVAAVACDRSKDRVVTAKEAARFGRALLERLGVDVRGSDGDE